MTFFAYYYKDIVEQPNKLFCLSFQFQNNNSCVFSIKKIELHGYQFELTEVVNIYHLEIYHPHKNQFYVAKKCDKNESNYDEQQIQP